MGRTDGTRLGPHEITGALGAGGMGAVYRAADTKLGREATPVGGPSLHFLAMEPVEGEDLAERLERRPIPADEALAFAVQVAEALQAAHEKGMVHGY